MTDQVTNPNPNDAPADAPASGEDTALAAAAKVDDAPSAEPKDDDAPVNDKPADQDKSQDAPEGAPDTYDTAAWKMPEGVEFDTEGFTAVEPVLRDLNLSQDQAGKLMTTYAEKIVPMIQQRTAQAFDDKAAELRADLARDLQADPEVGGKKLDESRAFAAKAIAHFIPDKDERNEFSTFLNESGLGNHRLLMRLVTGAGRAISEASTPAAETAAKPLSEAEKFYGKGGN
jgi:hypothetical protein